MSRFQSVRCYRAETAGVEVASCFGLPGKRRIVHSPTGYEWGYGGSGPADLALNILARVRPLGAQRNGVRLHDGFRVSDEAWDLHQDFKRDVIARMPRWGFQLTRSDVECWIAERLGNERDANLFGHKLMQREYDRPLRKDGRYHDDDNPRGTAEFGPYPVDPNDY